MMKAWIKSAYAILPKFYAYARMPMPSNIDITDTTFKLVNDVAFASREGHVWVICWDARVTSILVALKFAQDTKLGEKRIIIYECETGCTLVEKKGSGLDIYPYGDADINMMTLRRSDVVHVVYAHVDESDGSIKIRNRNVLVDVNNVEGRLIIMLGDPAGGVTVLPRVGGFTTVYEGNLR